MDMATHGPNRPTRDVDDFVLTDLGPRFLNTLDTKLARQAKKSLNLGIHSPLVSLTIDPLAYRSADVFARDLQVVSLLSKYSHLDLGIDTAEVAMLSFKTGEQQCGSTNARLKARYDTPTLGVSGDSLIEAARLKISRLLGEFSWDDIEPYLGFSSGSTTRLTRAQGDAYYKFQGKPDVTASCALLACCAIERVPRWARRIRDEFGMDPLNWVNVVPGNHITTVPKNAKTDRVIAIEPDLNMYLQRGVGGLIRSRLKRVGIDLDNQAVNQRFALEGSLNDRLATIDLKAASDTVSIAIVERLLDQKWFGALDMLRCKYGTLPSGEIVHYQKFSSMGNGFTFELESLIFWALCSAVVDFYEGEHRVVVYGDDIIVPSATSGFVIELLAYCGFTTNEAKTHLYGPYRESCGKHYFNGHDVTPFFIKAPVKTCLDKFWLANSIRRWASRLSPGIADPRYFKVWRHVVVSVSHNARRWIPDGVGDGGFIGTFAECSPSKIGGLWTVAAKREVCGRRQRVDGYVAILRAFMFMGRDALDGGAFVSESPDIREVGFERIIVETSKRKIIDVKMKFLQWVDAPSWCC